MTDSAHILVVDNYDSFVYTIVGYLQTLGATVDVVRNDAIDPAAPGVLDGYDGVLISPGPGAPAESGASEDMIRLCAASGVPSGRPLFSPPATMMSGYPSLFRSKSASS